MIPFFSIVIPTYNRGYLIEKTIDNVYGQEFASFEVIVIDDGSTDSTAEVLDSLLQKYSNLKYYRKKNEERGKARNYGYEKANGEYVVFFDSDDEMLSHYLQTLHDAIIKSSPNFIAAKFIIVDGQGKVVNKGNSGQKPGLLNYNSVLKGNFLACNFAIKRNNPELIPFVDDRSYASLEDWMFILENLRKDELLFIDKICIHMIEHEGRSMSNNKDVIIKRIKANERMLEVLNIDEKSKIIMTAYSYYFCAIHSYLDQDAQKCYYFLKKAFALVGIKSEFLTLIIKNILGFNQIRRLKRVLAI